MKVFSVFKFGFPLVGAGMLIGAFFLFKSSSTFLESAVSAEGTVVDMVRSGSTSSNDSPTYRPVVEFTTVQGQPVRFTSSVGTSPPAYTVGDTVEVLYPPTAPQAAKLNGFFDLWGGATILGGMGAFFFAIGASIFLFSHLRARRETHLRHTGVAIDTQFQSVEQNHTVRVNGRYPFRIITQWQNPATSEIHLFHSSNLWWDPSDHIGIYPIKVFIEKNNPKKYCMDLSFLPKLAS